jgi:hypothetical protein
MTVLVERVRRFVPSREKAAKATCPNDRWTFTPRYTEGVCPLCGWKPEGIEYKAPLAARTDWFIPSIVFMVLVSVLMGVLVVLAYNHK